MTDLKTVATYIGLDSVDKILVPIEVYFSIIECNHHCFETLLLMIHYLHGVDTGWQVDRP